MIRLAVFDFDGTLCVTHEAIEHCLRRTFERHALAQPGRDAIHRTIRRGIGLAETFASLLGAEAGPGIPELVTTYRGFYNSGDGERLSRPFEGAAAVLATLKARGIAVVVASNKGEAAVLAALSRFGLADHVDLAVCETPGVARKPDPDSYLNLIAPHFPGLAPESVLVIGDTAADLEYARNIGASVCWARYGYGDADACEALEPDHVIDDIGELATREALWRAPRPAGERAAAPSA